MPCATDVLHAMRAASAKRERRAHGAARCAKVAGRGFKHAQIYPAAISSSDDEIRVGAVDALAAACEDARAAHDDRVDLPRPAAGRWWVGTIAERGRVCGQWLLEQAAHGALGGRVPRTGTGALLLFQAVSELCRHRFPPGKM